MTGLVEIQKAIKAIADPERAKGSARFFKSGEGQYGYGDKFLGLNNPDCHKIAKDFKELSFEDTIKLLQSEWHEERLIALFILIDKFRKLDLNSLKFRKINDSNAKEKLRENENLKKQIFDAYIKNTKYINNWDLVDSSAGYIVGSYLIDKPRDIIYKLAVSKDLWEKRISIISTFAFIWDKDYKDALAIAEILLHDEHDLIHKAVGWSLREVGKKCGNEIIEKFLDKYAKTMPRTMLRYSLEKFPPEKRKFYMTK